MSLGSLQSATSLVPIPIGARVHIAGEPGVYVVTATDPRRYTVNLVSADGGTPHFGIHISAVTLVNARFETSVIHNARNLINEILGS